MLASAAVSKPSAASSSRQGRPSLRRSALVCRAAAPGPNAADASLAERCARGAAAAAASLLMAQSALAGSFTFDELQAKSYLEVKGSTLANQCSSLGADAQDGLVGIEPGSYSMDKFCMEPSSIKVRLVGKDEFQPSTLLTRSTYSLDQMTGSVTVGKDGTVSIKQADGIDFAPVTVKVRGGEMIPFMFTVKEMALQGPADGLTGEFLVPSYRGATFMDPQGRGAASGWDYVKGLQGAGAQDGLEGENIKVVGASRGEAAFAVSKSDAVTREIGGVFVTRQLADDDLGSKQPATIEVEGVWYAQLD